MLESVGIFLDKNHELLLLLITFVYVIATILIFYMNKKAADASQKQVIEMQRQYRDSNRPYITCEYILLNRVFCGIRITNHGNMVAKDLTFAISSDFIKSLDPEHFIDFPKLNDSHYKLVGIGQSFDFIFSSAKNKPKVPFHMTIYYRGEVDKYSETFNFDLEKQLPIYSVTEFSETLIKAIKEQNDILSNIQEALLKKSSGNLNK